jgi:hypothetical protein
MRAVRARDLRALSFCLISIPLLYAIAEAWSGDRLMSAAITAAYAAIILSRPRMIRVYRRLSGERIERSSYYKN